MVIAQFFAWIANGQHWVGEDGVANRLGEHLLYTIVALVIAFVIAFPIGLYIGHTGRGAFLAINISNAGRALPTVGFLILLVLLTTIGPLPTLIALTVLAIPPIMTSTYAAIQQVEPDIVDAARGMGMKESQVLFQAELPASLAIVVGGLRTATLQVVSTATVAAFIGGGGLGRLLIDGQSNRDYTQMFAGAVLVAVLAIVLDLVFIGLIRVTRPGGLAVRAKGTVIRTEEAATAAAS